MVVVGSFVILNTVLGAVVILRNPHSSLNRAFLFMTVSMTLWAVNSTISDATTSLIISRYASYLAFGFSFLSFCAAYIFSEVFRVGRLRRRHYALLGVGGVMSVLFSTPLVYYLVTINTYRNGALYPVFIASSLTLIALTARNFIVVMRRGEPQQKIQARFMVLGFLGTSALALLTNAIIPALFNADWITRFGPMFTSILIASIAYSMVRHRLFDLRFAVARTLAYVLTLGVIAGLYAVVLIGVLSHFVDQSTVSWTQQLGYIAMALLLATTFQPIKRFFDRLTNSWFYQDAYDAQDFFNQLNKLLVSSLDIKYLMKSSVQIITDTLKPEYCLVVLDDGEKGQRIFGAHDKLMSIPNAEAILRMASGVRRKVIVADEIDQSHQQLSSAMADSGLAILVRLAQSAKAGETGLGYVALGQKKSGYAYSRKDIQVLEVAGNELVIAMQNALHFEEIQQFNDTLQQRVDDATHKLRTTNDKLRKLDETKDEFISMASHQLRTPLTSVKGYLSMVLEGDAGKLNDQQEKLLKQSFMSSQRMVYLISDLLNLSRLNTGKFVIESTPVDLREVVKAQMDQLAETAKAREIKLSYDSPAEFPKLMLDETKIHQVVMNFMDNAIYYTPPGGKVDVKLVETPTAIEFRVEDNGIGVPKDERHHLFSKFYRANNAKQARPDGTGLGLFMAKKVIVAQSGSIIFETEEGVGSTFGFRFSKAGHVAPEGETAVTPQG